MSSQTSGGGYVPNPLLFSIARAADPVLRILYLLSEARYLVNVIHQAKTKPESDAALAAHSAFKSSGWIPPGCQFSAEIQAALSRPAVAHLITNGVNPERAEQAVRTAVMYVMILMGLPPYIAPISRWYELYGMLPRKVSADEDAEARDFADWVHMHHHSQENHNKWKRDVDCVHFAAGVEKELGDVAALGKLLYPPMRYEPPSPYEALLLQSVSNVTPDTSPDTEKKNRQQHRPRNLAELKKVHKQIARGKKSGLTQSEAVREYVEETYRTLETEKAIEGKVNSLIRSLSRYRHLIE